MVNQSIIETAERFAQQIPADLMLKKVYLFGSFAKGNETEESDIDIAVVLGNMTNFFDTQMQLMRIRRKIDLRIEPHPISDADFIGTNPFAYEILRTGIELPLNNQIASEQTIEFKSLRVDK
ncbi:MAG: nucleotidyltransferase domain-containing protein [Bacteroidales bacterium]